jgi:plastocyanin
MSRQSTRWLVAVGASAIVLAGCGGGGGGGGGGSSTPSSGASGGSASSGGGGKSVTISNFKFAPAAITVPAGSKVTVTNKDTTAHTATANDNSFDTKDINPSSSSTISLKTAGRVPYHCSIHPFMHGTIVVR